MFTAPKKKSNKNPTTTIQPTQSPMEPLEGGVKIARRLTSLLKRQIIQAKTAKPMIDAATPNTPLKPTAGPL